MAGYNTAFSKYILPVHGDKSIKEISGGDIVRLQGSMHGQGLSQGSIKTHLSKLRTHA